MKKARIPDDIRTIKGVSIYEVLKSIINESNFSDEDLEYEAPKQYYSHYRCKNTWS